MLNRRLEKRYVHSLDGVRNRCVFVALVGYSTNLIRIRRQFEGWANPIRLVYSSAALCPLLLQWYRISRTMRFSILRPFRPLPPHTVEIQ